MFLNKNNIDIFVINKVALGKLRRTVLDLASVHKKYFLSFNKIPITYGDYFFHSCRASADIEEDTICLTVDFIHHCLRLVPW